MCGRFAQESTIQKISEHFHVQEKIVYGAHYNIAPTQQILTVKTDDAAHTLALMHWGLIPSWAKDRKMAARMINARAETVAEKPAFRAAYRHRRCLIPASGFYEWKKEPDRKQPYFITLRQGGIMVFAGLWETWQQTADLLIESCTILTINANALVRPIHDRMPVIITPAHFDLWLDTGTDPVRLRELLSPFPSETLTAYPVSTLVNKAVNDSPECIKRQDT